MRAVRVVLLALAILTSAACEPAGSPRDCSFTRPVAAPALILAEDTAAKPRPKATKTRAVNTCSKGNSPIWRLYKPYKGDWRTDGGDKFYQWDNLHGDIEEWERRGGRLHHLGSLDPNNGRKYKGPKHPTQRMP
uniref:Colicin E3-like ribonuclease domain-containing protein n=1 Tax=uncultured Armatimonadetes bacterium TaxID=157466 RepID=A0A6J4HTF7_9BACT|nr:hypothetical protein AVDCRST_MAG63-1004 [uncultured Armatimonadetes bacterium]